MYNPVEYFDEMNILKDDKLRRKKTAKEFINALVDFLKHSSSILFPAFSFTKRQVLIMKMNSWISILP